MRYLLIAITLILVQNIQAQHSLHDSTLKEFSRLICECATLLKIDHGNTEQAEKNFNTCIYTNIGVNEQKEWIKKEWLEDSAWSLAFYKEIQKELTKSCPAYIGQLNNFNPVAPKPVPKVNEKYFLADVAMIKRGFEKNTNTTTALCGDRVPEIRVPTKFKLYLISGW